MWIIWLRPRLGRRASRPVSSAIGTALGLLIGAALTVHLGLADMGLRATEGAVASAHRMAGGQKTGA